MCSNFENILKNIFFEQFCLGIPRQNKSYQFRFVDSNENEIDKKIGADMDIASFLRKPCSTCETDVIQLQEHPYVKEIFKKFNAVCTSSAPSERLFSCAGEYHK